MSVELLQTLSLGGFVASGAFLILTVVIFFTLRIPEVIGDLSGATARKAIEDIRQQNEASGDKAYRPSRVNRERGGLTDKISSSGRLVKKTGRLVGGASTSKLNTAQLVEWAQNSAETTILQPETTILSESTSPKTTVLTAELSQQMVTFGVGDLQEKSVMANQPKVLSGDLVKPQFTVEVDLGFCESAEIIE